MARGGYVDMNRSRRIVAVDERPADSGEIVTGQDPPGEKWRCVAFESKAHQRIDTRCTDSPILICGERACHRGLLLASQAAQVLARGASFGLAFF